MKSFKEYLEQSIRKYNYRVKVAIVDITEERLDKIERIFSKYEIYEMTLPKKTIIQEHPLDFYDLSNVDVTIIDIVTRVPISPYNVQQEIKVTLNIPETYIVVRNWDEPREKETQRMLSFKEIEAEANDKDMVATSVLSTESSSIENTNCVDGKKLFGNEYNLNLLKYLSNVAASRYDSTISTESTLSNPEKIKQEKQADFNSDIKDAPRSIPFWEKPNLDKNMDISSVQGKYDNVTDEINTIGKIYKNKKGERIFFKGNK
jgi:hypothetical protein